MDDAAEARFMKIESLLSTFTESVVAAELAAERRQAEWQKRQEAWEKRQDRLDRRVDRFARAGLTEVRNNRRQHEIFFQGMEQLRLRIAEIGEKLDAIIKIEQDRQPPQR